MTSFSRDWNTAYEGQPAQTEDINLGATRIRNLKVDVRERLQVDHAFADNTGQEGDDGKHLQVTFVARGSAPTIGAGNGALYVQTISGATELLWKDDAGHVVQLTTGGSLLLPAGGTFAGNVAVTGTFAVGGTAAFSNNVSIAGTLGVGGATSITTSLSVGTGGIATSGGVAAAGTVAGAALNISGAGVIDGALILGSLALIGPVSQIMNDTQFFLGQIAGKHSLNVAAGTFITFNPAVPQWEFYIASVLVGHFP